MSKRNSTLLEPGYDRIEQPNNQLPRTHLGYAEDSLAARNIEDGGATHQTPFKSAWLGALDVLIAFRTHYPDDRFAFETQYSGSSQGIAHGTPLRAAATFVPSEADSELDGEVTFTGTQAPDSVAQKGPIGGTAEDTGERDDSEWDEDAFEYATDYGILEGTNSRTSTAAFERGSNLWRIHVGFQASYGGYLVDGDCRTEERRRLIEADTALQLLDVPKDLKQLIKETVEHDRISLRRWNAHHYGYRGAVVGFAGWYLLKSSTYLPVDRLRDTAEYLLLEKLVEKRAADELQSLRDDIAEAGASDEVLRRFDEKDPEELQDTGVWEVARRQVRDESELSTAIRECIRFASQVMCEKT